VYGYYRTGAAIRGVKSIVFMHLLAEDGKHPLCGNYRQLTLSEFTLGKPICKGCSAVAKRQEKRKAKKEKLLREIEISALMF
jgi:hypothetical protein